MVCRPDKGKGVVIVDKLKYRESMNALLSDGTIFEVIEESVERYSTKMEDKINNFIQSIKSKCTITVETIKTLRAT